MGINKIWQSTYAFRRFRQKTNDLSRIYWTQQMATDCLQKHLLSKDPNSHPVDEIGCSFEKRMYTENIADTLFWLPNYMGRNRLHLLVIYTAFLETYLKEITFYYIASMGYISNKDEKEKPIKLTKVGEAYSSPIIKSSTVPEMIKYASELFDINFGKNAAEWNKIYKVRCVAAHNGGIATSKFLQEISGMPLDLNPQENDHIGLTWDELRTAMRYADEIAALIDSKISNPEIRILEAEQVMRELKRKNALPARNKIWQILHDRYSFFPIKKAEKSYFLNKFYQ